MHSTIRAMALSVAGLVLASGMANAAPAIGNNPNSGASAVQKVQEFGIYIGPRYGYRDRYYRDYDYGYGYGYNSGYYYGPRRYYDNDGYRYRGERRTFDQLNRKAP